MTTGITSQQHLFPQEMGGGSKKGEATGWFSPVRVSTLGFIWCFGWVMGRAVLFFSNPLSKGWSHHGHTFSIYLCPLSFWLTLSRGVLSIHWCCSSRIQPVHGLPRLCAPGTVPCTIPFSRQLPCFLTVWPQYASFLALTASNSFVFIPALLRTHSFVFFAVHETCRIFLRRVSAGLSAAGYYLMTLA